MLLLQYLGQWVGFADGKIIVCGKSPVAVFHAAEATDEVRLTLVSGTRTSPF